MTTELPACGRDAGGAGRVSDRVAERLLMTATGVLRRRPPVER